MKTLAAIIADSFPLAIAADMPSSKRAANLLKTLNEAGYAIVPKQCPEDVLSEVLPGASETDKGTFSQQYAKAVRLANEAGV